MHVREFREISVPELDKYIIIDTHGGEEDIVGIAVALALAERFEKIVLGITCVNGRRTLQQAAHDALVAQQIAGTKVPVYLGSQQSILLRRDYPLCYGINDHSQELDNLPIEEEYKGLIQAQYAPKFIADQITKYSDQLCIITLGPLTNLALAHHRTQEINILSSVRINGGAFTGVGNVINSSGSEGNFAYDPEAAHIVISNYSNIYVNPIEKTLETSWRQYFEQLQQKSKETNNRSLNAVLGIVLSNQEALCGPLLTVPPAFLRQTVQKVLNVYSEVMIRGNNIVGLMAPNWLRLDVADTDQKPNTKIYSDFDMKEIQKIVRLALFK